MKALLVSLLLLPIVALAQAPVIQISGANFRPLPLAVPAPLSVDEGGKRLATGFDEAFLFDLRASGIFQVLDRSSFTADPKEGVTAGSINFSRWSDVGAEVLAKVQLGAEGGTLRGELRLFNVGTGREDFKVSHDVPATEPRQLAHLLADALYRHLTREPSPFLSRIAFVRKAGANRDVWVADWDGNNARAVTHGGINLLPALGPGGAVAFTSYRKGRPDLYVQRPGENARPVVQNGQMATGIAWSPDGKRIAYALADGESTQLYVANADGSSPKAVTNTPYGINSSPTWSPDGKRIAFVSNRGGSPQIYVMNADGSDVQRISYGKGRYATPVWSPRGDLIAFTRMAQGEFYIGVMKPDGSGERLLTKGFLVEGPTWAPNGRVLSYFRQTPGNSNGQGATSRLYTIDLTGYNEREVVTPLDASDPAWSPLIP